MRTITMIFAFFIIPCLKGCTSIPPYETQDYVRMVDIYRMVECELKYAVDQIGKVYPRLAYNQLVTAKYNLKVIDTGAGAGDTSIVVPVTNGAFTIGFTAGLTKKATRNSEVTVDYRTNDLHCPGYDGSRESIKRFDGDDIGLANWLLSASSSLQAVDETPTAMTYNVEFDVTANGSVNPKVGLERMKGHKFSGGIKLTGTHQKTHGILVAVAEIKSGNVARAKNVIDREITNFLLMNSNR